MQDWSKYIERPIVEVLPELEAEGYRVTSDECVIFGQRNIDIEKGDVAAEIVCAIRLRRISRGQHQTRRCRLVGG